MILIDYDGRDPEIFEVANWLKYLKKDFLINSSNGPVGSLNFQKIKINSDESEIQFDKFSINEIRSYWSRKSDLNIDSTRMIGETITKDQKFYHQQFLHSEFKIIIDFIFNNLGNLKSLVCNDINNNKLNNLLIAKESLLNIPDSFVTSNRDELIEFINNHERVVVKPLYHGAFCFDNNLYNQYSIMLNCDNINEIPINFYPSFFQTYVDKKIEVRAFYLNGNIKAMAIFSQNDNKTKFDFRNYNINKPNRTVPIQLPDHLNLKLCNFMDRLKLKTGSIDLIYTPMKEFVFLEVNPEGMFNQVSVPTNYYLEMDIANYL